MFFFRLFCGICPKRCAGIRVFVPKVHGASSFVSVSRLHGQVVQAFVVLLLTDRPVFEEGIKQRHLPGVQLPSLFLRGHGFPCCVVRRVHRATVLPAGGIVPCRCAGFKSRLKFARYYVEIRRKICTQTAQRPVKVAGKTMHSIILHKTGLFFSPIYF